MSITKFKQFIQESVDATIRQNMMHLQKMPDIEFIHFAQHIQSSLGGRLQNVDVSLKVDGGGARFGLDAHRNPFFEGSRTGPIFQPKSFSQYAKSKGATGINLDRAYHYDDMWEIITQSKFIRNLPPDTKVICEVFYNPMGEITDSGIKFVSVSYDKNKLGNVMTIIPFKVVIASSGKDHPQSSEIIDNLLRQSTSDIKFISPKLHVKGSIDISTVINPINQLNNNSIQILQSRKKDDKEQKAIIKALIQDVKEQLADFILKHPAIIGKDMLGPDIEGLVLNMKNHQLKVTTPEFKASKVKK